MKTYILHINQEVCDILKTFVNGNDITYEAVQCLYDNNAVLKFSRPIESSDVLNLQKACNNYFGAAEIIEDRIVSGSIFVVKTFEFNNFSFVDFNKQMPKWAPNIIFAIPETFVETTFEIGIDMP